MKKIEKTKKITIDQFAILMKAGFSSVNKKINNAVDLVDKLAIFTAKGFENTATKEDIKRLENDIEGVKKDIEGVKKNIEGVKNQLEGTNKRIDDFAESKVSKITFKELDNRVGFMEEKLEIKQ